MDEMITRVVLSDEEGVVYEKVGLSVMTSLQDGGRTLKIWVKEDNPEAAAQWREEFGKDVVDILETVRDADV